MSSDDEDDDEKVKTPSEQYDKIEAAPLPPMGPDGGPMIGGIGQAPAVPAATADNFVCLRGPCRHYWELHTWMGAGNPAETWGEDGLRGEDGAPLRQPRQINRACLAHPGTETELTEDCVYFCNKWDPIDDRDRDEKKREKRRSKYLKLYPQHAPAAPGAHAVVDEIDADLFTEPTNSEEG